jgi:hypothetical protein
MLLEIAGNYEIFIRILRWNDTALPLPASDHQAGFGVAGVDFPVLLVRHARWRSAAFEMRRLGACPDDKTLRKIRITHKLAP